MYSEYITLFILPNCFILLRVAVDLLGLRNKQRDDISEKK